MGLASAQIPTNYAVCTSLSKMRVFFKMKTKFTSLCIIWPQMLTEDWPDGNVWVRISQEGRVQVIERQGEQIFLSRVSPAVHLFWRNHPGNPELPTCGPTSHIGHSGHRASLLPKKSAQSWKAVWIKLCLHINATIVKCTFIALYTYVCCVLCVEHNKQKLRLSKVDFRPHMNLVKKWHM